MAKQRIPLCQDRGAEIEAVLQVMSLYMIQMLMTMRMMILVIKLVKFSLCLTKHHAMKAYWGVKV
jgi:hypothetical protein